MKKVNLKASCQSCREMHVAFVNFARIMRQVGTKGRFLSKKVFSKKYLLYTNVGISITLSGVGDFLEQQYEMASKELERWDMCRTRNMSVSGCTVGILCHYWYSYLDSKLPGRTIATVAKKVLVDQIICSPVTITVFFVTLALLENSSARQFAEEVRRKAWRLYAAEWVIWPPAQVINFYILPTKYRVLYDNTISLGYDVYTSHVVKRNPNHFTCPS